MYAFPWTKMRGTRHEDCTALLVFWSWPSWHTYSYVVMPHA